MIRPTRLRSAAAQRGMSLWEVLIAALLLGVVLVPALEALRSGTNITRALAPELQRQYRLAGRMEEILAEPVDDLTAAAAAAGNRTTPSSYSDAAGTPDRRLVFLSLYDGDNADLDSNPFTGTDAGLVWVRVDIAGTPLSAEGLRAN